MKVINLETNEEDFNIIAYCTPPLIRRTTKMLTVSLFNGSTKIHDKLIKNVPQGHTGKRHLIMLAVIHEPDIKADVFKPKIMLYQDVEDPSHFWIRKETPGGENGQTNYSETDCEDAITALGGFETSVRVMLDRLTDKRRADRIDHSVATLQAQS